MDIWIAATPSNAEKVVRVLRQFGFSAASVKPDMFNTPDQIVRLGIPPICINVITGASGVEFAECYSRRNVRPIDGIEINIIHPDDLKQNKKASGRPKDLIDLENLP